MQRLKFTLIPILTGTVLVFSSWYVSYPVSIDPPYDFIYNHISTIYWLGSAILFASFLPHLLLLSFAHLYQAEGTTRIEVMKSYRLGFHYNTYTRLVSDVTTLLENKRLREEMGEKGRRCVEKEHDIRGIANKYVDIFRVALQS